MKKTQLQKKLICLLMLLAILVTSVVQKPMTAKAGTKEYKHLVLIETKDGLYTGYDDIIVRDKKNNIMLKAYTVSKALGLKYKTEGSKKFTITSVYKGNASFARPDKTIYYTKNKKEFSYNNSGSLTTITSAAAPYTVAASETSGAFNVIHYRTLDRIVNMEYYWGDLAGAYRDQGYYGVLVYSKENKIEKLPDIRKVRDKDGNYMFPDTNDNTKMEGKIMTIGGVNVPMVEGYKSPKSCDEGGFGNDVLNGATLYYDAIDWFCEYIDNTMEDLGYDVMRDSTKILYLDDFLRTSVSGDYNRPTFYFKKNMDTNQYELTLFVAIEGKYKEIYENCIKLYLAAFTSDVDKVYDALYDSYMGDETYGINKKTWTTVGNTKIKCAIVNKHAVYYFKKA